MRGMPDVVYLLRYVNVIFGAVLFGSMIMEHVMIIPVIRSRPPREGVEVLRAFTPIAMRYVPLCGQICGLAAMAQLALWRDLSVADFRWTLGGCVLYVVAVSTTFGFYLPADRAIRGLAEEAVAAEAPPLMRRWARFHAVRATFYLLAYALWVGAAL